MKKKPIFLLSFLTTYWRMLIVFVLINVLQHDDAVVFFIGPLFYLIALVVDVVAAVLFVKHMWFRSTIDAYTQDLGPLGFIAEWKSLSAEMRVTLTIAVVCTLFLGGAWIAASIAK